MWNLCSNFVKARIQIYTYTVTKSGFPDDKFQLKCQDDTLQRDGDVMRTETTSRVQHLSETLITFSASIWNPYHQSWRKTDQKYWRKIAKNFSFMFTKKRSKFEKICTESIYFIYVNNFFCKNGNSGNS